MRYWKIENRLFLFYFKVFLLLGIDSALFARDVEDFTNTKVKLSDHPHRVVTLAPSLGELAADILGKDINRIVGVTEYTHSPAELAKIESVGPYHQFNLEKVVTLKPDLVLATQDGNPKDRVNHLRELGIPVVVVNTESLIEIKNSILLVARALGKAEEGERQLALLNLGIEKISRSRPLKNKKSNLQLKVLLQVGDDPLVVAGQKSFLTECLSLVGATNIYFNSANGYPRPSIEDIILRNPDVILIMALGEEIGNYKRMKEKWLRFNTIAAVKNHRVYILKSDALLKPTPRILTGLTDLSEVLYGKSE